MKRFRLSASQKAFLLACNFIADVLGKCPLAAYDSIMTTGRTYGLPCLRKHGYCNSPINKCWARFINNIARHGAGKLRAR